MKIIRLLPLLGMMLMPAGTALAEFNEGIEYKRLAAPVATSDPKKVEVVELFWYGCPHCYHLEPDMKKWLKNKPANVVFVRVCAGPSVRPKTSCAPKVTRTASSAWAR